MVFSDIVDAIILQYHPIISGPHYLSSHYVPTGMCTTDSFMNLMYNFLGLTSIDTPQQYLELATENDKRTLRRLSMRFFLDGEVLYKKRKDQILLRCVMPMRLRKLYVRFTKVSVAHIRVGT